MARVKKEQQAQEPRFLLSDDELVTEAALRGYNILSNEEIQAMIERLKEMGRPEEDWKIYNELKAREVELITTVCGLQEEQKELSAKWLPSPENENRLVEISRQIRQLKSEVERVRFQFVRINYKQDEVVKMRDEQKKELEDLDREAERMTAQMEKAKVVGDLDTYRSIETEYFKNRATRKDVAARNVSMDTRPDYHVFAEQIQDEIRKKLFAAMLICNEVVAKAYDSALKADSSVAELRDSYDFTFAPNRKNITFSEASITVSYYSGISNLIPDTRAIRDRLADY